MRRRTKNEWIMLLKRALFKAPEHDGEHINEYFTKEDLIVTITTININRRNYIFGGPIWSAMVDLSGAKYLKVSFLSPRRKPYAIQWEKIKEISFHYLSA